jgi:hypothetical protein
VEEDRKREKREKKKIQTGEGSTQALHSKAKKNKTQAANAARELISRREKNGSTTYTYPTHEFKRAVVLNHRHTLFVVDLEAFVQRLEVVVIAHSFVGRLELTCAAHDTLLHDLFAGIQEQHKITPPHLSKMEESSRERECVCERKRTTASKW